ncbi:hypothetical protein NE865_04948 [Phthorimaea operculella]|nr:hypothetical protein NE865_04948 [Phthorimaea operculella]
MCRVCRLKNFSWRNEVRGHQLVSNNLDGMLVVYNRFSRPSMTMCQQKRPDMLNNFYLEAITNMKFLVAFALIVAVASAGVARNNFIDQDVQQIGQIIAAIESPSTDPATAVLLEQMLLELIGQGQAPIAVGPAIVPTPVGPSPISVGPAIIETPVGPSPISVGPAIIEDFFPIAPAPVVEPPTPVAPAPVAEVPAPAAPAQASSLVQIIVNVNAQNSEGVKPVSVNEPEMVAPAPIVKPTPVAVVDGAAPAAPAPAAPAPAAPAPAAPAPAAPAPVAPAPAAPAPVVLPEPAAPVVVEPVSPIQVAEPALPAPAPVSPIQVAEPALPAPAPVSPIQVAEPALPAPAPVSPVQVAEPNLPIGGAAPVVLPGQLN